MMAAVAGQLGSLAAKLSPPPLPGSSVKISQHVTLNITMSIRGVYFTPCVFLRGLLKSLKSCDVTQVFGFSVKLVFRRKRHTAIRIWCVLVPSRRESQNFVRMGSWGGGMLGDHLYASFGNITRGNRSTIFRDSFFLISNKREDLDAILFTLARVVLKNILYILYQELDEPCHLITHVTCNLLICGGFFDWSFDFHILRTCLFAATICKAMLDIKAVTG